MCPVSLWKRTHRRSILTKELGQAWKVPVWHLNRLEHSTIGHELVQLGLLQSSFAKIPTTGPSAITQCNQLQVAQFAQAIARTIRERCLCFVAGYWEPGRGIVVETIKQYNLVSSSNHRRYSSNNLLYPTTASHHSDPVASARHGHPAIARSFPW